MYQIHKCHLSEEPFEENEDGHRDGDDEREGEGGAIEAGVDPKAIAADPSCDACCADTASTEEGGQNKDGAEFCNHLQLLEEGEISHLVLLVAKCQEILNATLPDCEE